MGIKKFALIVTFVIIIIAAFGIFFLFKSDGRFVNNSTKKVFEDGSFSSIEVLVDNANVEFISTMDTTTTVEYNGKKLKGKKYIFETEIKKDKLSIQLKEKRKNLFSLGFFSFSSAMELTVKVPEKQYKEIIVNGDNGTIIAEATSAENIVLETDNGKIELKNVEATSVNVKSDNGKIILDHVSGEIFGETDNGDISFNTNDLDRRIELNTDNGRIEINTDKKPTNATFDAKTDNGRVIIFDEEKKNSVFGNGKNTIKLRSDNGRITVTHSK